MQKISLFKLFALEIHLILEPCKPIDQTHFRPLLPKKIINQNLGFLD